MARGKVCLAYSGGLDTSCILAWLLEQGYEVVCFMADVGQEEDFDAAKSKATKIGATACHVVDCRDEFVQELCFPAIQCNAIYEDVYLLGTSLARPVIARAMMRVAESSSCNFLSHGCTGKGNDQVRFELAFAALNSSMKVIAPWRDPVFYERFPGRNALLEYASQKGVPVSQTKKQPWSMDENLAHCSYEAGILEDPDVTPPEDMWKLTVNPLKAPDEPEDFSVEFSKGVPTKLNYVENGKKVSVTRPLDLFLAANTIGRRNGVGRVDIVENRYLGLKSRGCYETPGLSILRNAHIDIEGLVLDREVRADRDSLSTKWARYLYNGLYFSPERSWVEGSMNLSQKDVNGVVRCRVYKGSFSILGRSSKSAKLYDMNESSMDEIGGFAPSDTTGFIGVQAIRLKKYGAAKKEAGEKM